VAGDSDDDQHSTFRAADRVRGAGERAGERVREAGERVREAGERAGEKVREMPGPRENPGMVAPSLQRGLAWPYRALLAGLHAIGARPWHLTILSLGLNVVAGALLVNGRYAAGGLVLIPAGLADVFDGGLARLRGEESRTGAFLDSVLDRVSDLIIFGSLYWSLAGAGEDLAAGLALGALCVSVGVSFVRAEAEAGGLSLSEGLFQRTERYVATILGLLVPILLLPALALLCALGGFTLLQRLWMAFAGLRDVPRELPGGSDVP
jgi:CDP-diacylglycerol--glycerol-3-phosphate 3-phosphatidyltransferase